MDNIDLNFLTEQEVYVIVSVIEKDFELKAAEKSRLCRLRRKLIRNDQKAVELSQTTLDGLCCVICYRRFVFLLNPKKVCCSCSLQICKSCCKYMQIFENYVCSICQQQKDLIAMNCTWFYENIRRRFMDGGSQIVANSLSEYPRKNLISPAILKMVKGAQVTKFRHQIEEANRTIEESLIKVELSSGEKETKSIKFTELIKKFEEKLRQILRSTSQVLYITLINYNNKIGRDINIDLEVLNTLHEEVELLIGRKIDIRMCEMKLINGRRSLEDLDNDDSLETTLSIPIVDKLLADVHQSLIENRDQKYDDLISLLKSMVKKTKYDSMDFDLDSISQAPSRQGTIRRSFQKVLPQQPLYENSKSNSLESLVSSRLYQINESREKSYTVSKQWSELMTHSSQDLCDSASVSRQKTRSPSLTFLQEDDIRIDSDALSMHTTNQPSESNWLMKARYPLGSLNSLFTEGNYTHIKRKTSNVSFSARSVVAKKHQDIDEELNEIYLENKSHLNNSNDLSLDHEYKKNLKVVSSMPNLNNNQIFAESGESQDSGIVTCVNETPVPKPVVPSRKVRILKPEHSTAPVPEVPKRKSVTLVRPTEKPLYHDTSSVSSDENNNKRKMIIVKAKRK